MKLMSWTLNAPSSAQFNQYMQKINGQWTVINESAPFQWDDNQNTFIFMFQKYHKKIKSLGLHEFGVWIDGSIYNFRLPNYDNEREWENGSPVLNADETAIQNWCPTSIQYLMETFPEVEYALQFICFGQKVDRILHLNRESAQNTFIRQAKKIAELYRERFPSIVTIELDFEKTYTLKDGDPIYYDREQQNSPIEGYADGNDWEVYRDFIIRVKNEICLPLGMKLRVNMYAMTGDFTPSYYGWHDYKTLAAGKDRNGNQAIDEFQLMTYDFSYAYSAPGPSTPIWWLKEVLDHAKNSLPTSKTWIGNAGYGRRWGLYADQVGRTVTYKQLVMWQNGMYVHNHEDAENNRWVWHNQQWLPFVGWNDPESGYQITYPHMYDRFDITMSKDVEGEVNRTTYGEKNIATCYFKSQQPKFTGIKKILNEPSSISGNVSEILQEGTVIPARYLGQDVFFGSAKRANKAVYQFDSNLKACVPAPDETGKDGKIVFSFSLNSAGRYKLIALVHFNTYVNNEIHANLNGSSILIGGLNIEEWWPFYVDRYAWLEVGEFDFSTSNTITINPSSGYIWGFVVCEDFDQNFIGGQVEFNAYLAPFKKRGNIDEKGYLQKVTAEMPEKMTLTAELLRRPPRPAIIFEDTFSHYLNRSDEGYDITREPYYMAVQDYWEYGENPTTYGGENICTDSKGIYKIGFSDGKWLLQKDGTVKASVAAGYSNQLVLYKKFRCNIQVRADIKVSGSYPLAGIRFLANEEGNGNQGYLALLDYSANKVSVVYEDGNGGWEEIAYAWMSDQLIGMKGETTTITVSVLNGKVTVMVGDRIYLDGITLPYSISSGAYGVFIKGGTIVLSFLNISTIDRYEPMEKMQVEVDGKIYDFGEVPRNVGYDKYGYLVYSGLDVQSTELVPEDWGTDYKNEPLVSVPSWTGRKRIRVRMVDAGIWFTNFYIGDAEGFSVAWNSDLEGFIITSQLVNNYKCLGIAMWSLGQEDPLIFEYLPK